MKQKKWHYYNDIDPNVLSWVRELIALKLVPDGEVDGRSISEVQPDDVRGFVQCHWFCGVLGWPLALRLVGWPDDRPVWTGSCPCQPFSAAGKGRGVEDERHLWPQFYRLVKACQPKVVIGEQVASAEVVGTQLEAAFVDAVQRGEYAKANKLAHQLARSKSLHYSPRWLDGVRTDLEAAGYAVRADVLGAHSVGAPHIRQRLFWGGRRLDYAAIERLSQRSSQAVFGSDSRGQLERSSDAERLGGDPVSNGAQRPGREECESYAASEIGGLGVANGTGSQPGQFASASARYGRAVEPAGDAGGMAIAECAIHRSEEELQLSQNEQERHTSGFARSGELSSWSNFDLIPCADGKYRRIQFGTFPLVKGEPRGAKPAAQPLANGLSSRVVSCGDPSAQEAQATAEARVMRLKGYGNAIVPQVAAEFILAFMESAGK